ncbi:MAG: hypothetical protein IJ779_00640 [Ruminococcus sp.]|nr:hypothetical protein [Ruminococcus sp.]
MKFGKNNNQGEKYMFTKAAKRNYFIMMTAAAIAAYIVICTLGQNIHKEKTIQKQEAAAVSEVPVYCTVRESGGKLAVYRRDSSVPFMTLDVRTAMLSDYDREQFAQGVDLYSEDELKKLIEDFAD